MNMRYQAYLLPLVFIILAGSFLSAQNSLSGTVTDAQGMPLIGANLFFPDLKTGTITDENGHYEMKQLPAKKMLVQVSYVGYNTLLRPVEVQGNVTADFVLEEGHIESKEVVVTGLSMAQEKRRNTVSIDVLKKDFLLRSTGTNLVDNLTKVAGISAVTTGPGISKPIIRGLGYNRVLVVQDGIRQEGQDPGVDPADQRPDQPHGQPDRGNDHEACQKARLQGRDPAALGRRGRFGQFHCSQASQRSVSVFY